MIRFLEEDGSAMRRVVVSHGAVGDLTACVDARGAVVRVEWGDTSPGGVDYEGLDAVKENLQRWFAGEDVEVTVAPRGLGTMALAVLRVIAGVRPGDVTGYSDIAIAAGYGNAVRAVATAVGHNPLPVVIPCHRVVPAMAARLWRRERSAVMSDARLLGRYTPDDSLKPRLLSYELGRVDRSDGQNG
ncbi:MAG: methylated-DNA--[protein]-cysteine S-methyltransferase [Muribaculaceae bacterium]|nr:methylated-DNA--[protein]-cysteine S-methyltransferase [Muribaculaceae bacterium]